MVVRAIETEYKGYLFRSRLEARWAVFFDALGIPYLYEPEGFDLGGMWYLPDFYLQRKLPVLGGEDREFYVEIKAKWLDDAESRKAIKFVEKVPKVLLVALGDPWPETTMKWVERISSERWLAGDCVWMDFQERGIGVALVERISPDGWGRTQTDRLMEAYTAARRARFGRNGVRLR